MITIFYWTEDDEHYTEVDYYPCEGHRMSTFRHQKRLTEKMSPYGYATLDEQFDILSPKTYYVHKVLNPSEDQEFLAAVLIAKSLGKHREVM